MVIDYKKDFFFKSVWLSLTSKCNNLCSWCYASAEIDNKSGESEYPEEKVTKLLKELKVKQVILTGGEPTLYPNLLDFIKRLREAGMEVGMVTNGRKLSNKGLVKELKKSGLGQITFSIEGSNPKSHDAITQRNGSFEQTIQGLEESVREGIPTSTNTVICRQNCEELENIVKYLGNFELESIGFGSCRGGNSEEDNLSPKESAQYFERTYLRTRNNNLPLRLITPLPICSFKLSRKLEAKGIIYGGPCHIVSGQSFAVDSNGNVIPCAHFIEYPFFNLFNIKGDKKEFIRLYTGKGKTAHLFREHVSHYPSKKCNRGACSENCSGGCPIFWLTYDPEKEINGMGKSKHG